MRLIIGIMTMIYTTIHWAVDKEGAIKSGLQQDDMNYNYHRIHCII